MNDEYEGRISRSISSEEFLERVKRKGDGGLRNSKRLTNLKCAMDQIDQIFQQIREDPNVDLFGELLVKYSNSHDKNIFEYYSANFPFDSVSEIILQTDDIDMRDYAYQCFSSAIQGENFDPEQITEEFLQYVIEQLTNEDECIIKSTLPILSVVTKHTRLRDFLLENEVLAKISEVGMTYGVMEFIGSLCVEPLPEDESYVNQLSAIFERNISDSEVEEQIVELTLDAILCLLRNETAGFEPDAFSEHIIKLAFIDVQPLAAGALQVITYFEDVSDDFLVSLAGILERFNYFKTPPIIQWTAAIIRRFHVRAGELLGPDLIPLLVGQADGLSLPARREIAGAVVALVADLIWLDAPSADFLLEFTGVAGLSREVLQTFVGLVTAEGVAADVRACALIQMERNIERLEEVLDLGTEEEADIAGQLIALAESANH